MNAGITVLLIGTAMALMAAWLLSLQKIIDRERLKAVGAEAEPIKDLAKHAGQIFLIAEIPVIPLALLAQLGEWLI